MRDIRSDWYSLRSSCIGEAIEAAVYAEQWPRSVGRLKSLALAFVLCLAVVAINPNGLRLYSYPFETLSSPAMQKFIQEWFSPDFHDPMYLPLLFMLLALLAGLALSPRRVRPRDLVLLMAVVPAALRSMRHIPILMLVLVPIVAGLAEPGSSSGAPGGSCRWVKHIQPGESWSINVSW